MKSRTGKEAARFPLRIVAGIVLLQLLPLALFFVLLSPDGPILPLALFLVAANVLFYCASHGPDRGRKLHATALVLLLIFGAIVIVSDIVIIPYSAYLSWFRLIEEGEGRGAISFLFVMLAGYFSALFAGFVYRHGFARPLAAEGFAILTLLAVIYQQPFFLAAAIAVLLIGLGYAASMHYRGSAKYGPVRGVAALAVSAFSGALLLSFTMEPRGSSFIDLTLSPLLRTAIVTAFPEFPIIYGIPGYGYSFDRRGTGNSPLLSERPIFEVRGRPGSTVYLRTAVYSTYQDGSWAVDQYLLDRAYRRNEGLPGYADAGSSAETVEVTLLQDFYSMVPHTLDMDSVSLEGSRYPQLQYGSMDTGFFLATPIVRGAQIRIVRDQEGAPFERNTLRNRLAFLQIPRSVSSSLVDLANSFPARDPYALALEIREYLARQSVYTLDTRRSPNGIDMVEDFLFTSREGYCVHFASAFVLLARIRGLPTRYVTGFLVNIPYTDDTARVSGLSAHAWPEVWIPEHGWVSIEATPPMIGGSYEEWYYGGYTGGESELTSRQLEEILGNRQEDPAAGLQADDAAGFGREEDATGSPLLPALLILPLSLLVPGIVLGVRRSGILIRDPRRKLRFHAAEAVRRARTAGIPGPERDGWIAWGEEVRRRLGTDRGEIVRQAVGVLLSCFYRNRSPDGDDLALALRLRRIAADIPRSRHRLFAGFRRSVADS